MRNEFDILNDAEIDLSVYDETMLSEREKNNMKKVIKKKPSIRKIAVLAACISVLGIVSQTALAQDFFVKVVKTISTGHNKFVEIDMTDVSVAIPECMEGLVFDKDGSKAAFYREGAEYYDKEGNLIENWDKFLEENVNALSDDIKIAMEEKNDDPLENGRKTGWTVINNIDDINGHLCFDAKIPEYIPKGYKFYGAMVGEDSQYYLFIYYINEETGKYFTIHERFMNEETAFESSGGKINEIDLNGHKAVVTNGTSVDWEQDGIAIGVRGRGVISYDRLIDIARSIK